MAEICGRKLPTGTCAYPARHKSMCRTERELARYEERQKRNRSPRVS